MGNTVSRGEFCGSRIVDYVRRVYESVPLNCLVIIRIRRHIQFHSFHVGLFPPIPTREKSPKTRIFLMENPNRHPIAVRHFGNHQRYFFIPDSKFPDANSESVAISISACACNAILLACSSLSLEANFC